MPAGPPRAQARLRGYQLEVMAQERCNLVEMQRKERTTVYEQEMEDGDVMLPDSARIAHLAQHTPDSDRAALQFVLDGDTELRRVQRQIEQAEAEEAHERLGALHARLDAMDGYAAEARAGSILHGLGFRGDDFARPAP